MDPRTALADWANSGDEWIRFLVRHVLATGRPLAAPTLDDAYDLFREEKGLDPRSMGIEPALEVELGVVQREAALTIARVDEVHGVNALAPGAVIDFNDGLTILFGENGTGKTGYARILKALAASRKADPILPNVHEDAPSSPRARIDYSLGGVPGLLQWTGETGKAPFTRMSVFDSPAVNFHVDDDLEYVYTPATLALFTHVTNALQAIQEKAGVEVRDLTPSSGALLSRFKRGSSLYPKIETLGASTDLAELEALQIAGVEGEERLTELQRSLGALQSNAAGTQLAALRRVQRVIAVAAGYASTVAGFDAAAYEDDVSEHHRLAQEYSAFRDALFAAARLPAAPDETWQRFIVAGEAYRRHLQDVGAASADLCLYCRQSLSDDAARLLDRYGALLEDVLATRLDDRREALARSAELLSSQPWAEVDTFLDEQEAPEDAPDYVLLLGEVSGFRSEINSAVASGSALDPALIAALASIAQRLDVLSTEIGASIDELDRRVQDRDVVMGELQRELLEHEARLELGKVMPDIRVRVARAKRAHQLEILSRKLPATLRQVTELSKAASEALINQNFEALFAEECNALRAPELRLEFVGRQGRAQRRKVLAGKHRPSKVLSEGEQKVIAIADFLAEARLTGITAPVVFDDPVTSLDHRRINEVADRVAALAKDNQVIVFTHDILFATNLLSRFEKTTKCTYFQVSDEGGKGQVARATGPRWDTVKNITKQINATIEAAKKAEGELRASLVRTGYDWIRSWCEVFTEMELLQEVTQRYQPNVKMTMLPKIKSDALPDAIETITKIFEDACRHIDGHSQPLVTLAVSPTLTGLESDWNELQECRKAYLAA